VGLRLFRLCGWQNDSAFEDILGFGLGAGLSSAGLFFLGLAGLLQRPVLEGYGLILALIGMTGWIPRLRSSRFSGMKQPLRILLLWGALFYSLWHGIVLALTPPTEWDILAYHLAIPKLYLQAGRLYEIPWLLHSHWPHATELLYLLPLAFSADRAAALLHLGFAVGILVGMYQMARQEYSAPTALLGATLMAAQPMFLRFAGTAHADAALAFFWMLSARMAWQWRTDPKRRWLFLSAVFGGFTISAKLIGIVLVGTLTVWTALQPTAWKEKWRCGSLFLFIALATAAPWFVKTWAWSGSPVWPFASSWFGGRWGAASIETPYRAVVTWTGNPSFAWWRDGQAWFAIGPLAGLALLGFWQRVRWPAPLRFFLLINLPYTFVLWHHTEFWRFLWPVLPAFCLTTAWLASELVQRGSLIRCFSAAILGVSFIPLWTASESNALFPVLGIRSRLHPEWTPREAYLTKAMDIYAACEQANHLVGSSQKLLLYKEIRGYYFDVPYQWGDPVNQGLLAYQSMPDGKMLAAALQTQGITHVFINEGRYRYDPRIERLMNAVLQHYGRKIFSENGISIYELQWNKRMS
jgi:hypothetical protein